MDCTCSVCEISLIGSSEYQYEGKSYCLSCVAAIALHRLKKVERQLDIASTLLKRLDDFFASQPWCIEDIVPDYYDVTEELGI